MIKIEDELARVGLRMSGGGGVMKISSSSAVLTIGLNRTKGVKEDKGLELDSTLCSFKCRKVNSDRSVTAPSQLIERVAILQLLSYELQLVTRLVEVTWS
jgi:hypothetical protein